jgi:hypothetical protein
VFAIVVGVFSMVSFFLLSIWKGLGVGKECWRRSACYEDPASPTYGDNPYKMLGQWFCVLPAAIFMFVQWAVMNLLLGFMFVCPASFSSCWKNGKDLLGLLSIGPVFAACQKIHARAAHRSSEDNYRIATCRDCDGNCGGDDWC